MVLHIHAEQFSSTAEMVVKLKKHLATRVTAKPSVSDLVTKIIAEVMRAGDEALLQYSYQFDNYPKEKVSQVADLMVSLEQAKKIYHALPLDLRQALTLAYERIRDFHLASLQHYELQEDFVIKDKWNMMLGYRWSAIEKIGIYVPGGLAAYPSSVLMNAIPAKLAGAKEITMVCPVALPKNLSVVENFCLKDYVAPMVLAAAHLVGVDKIFLVGGAQAIAALAHGTATISAVDKIVGPGNRYVAEAKKQVFGKVGIDLIAGPSEVLILADKHASPKAVALDLMSQAEHDPETMSILITDSVDLVVAVEAMIAEWCQHRYPTVSHNKMVIEKQLVAKTSWQNFGAMLVVKDLLKDGAMLANIIAAEHVEIMMQEPEVMAQQITAAGAIFLGYHTPEALGDYLAGPNHVLPTYGTARFSSGLSVFDFLKRTSMIKADSVALANLSAAVINLAHSEQLPAHAESIQVRLKKTNN